MKKETYIKKAGELYDSIIPIQNEIRQKSEKFIKKVLEENGGSLDFDDYDVNNWVSVPYDGGNHPEYASDCFSTVNGVFFDKDGDIALNIEDCSNYPIENINWDDVYNVAEYINNEILKNR